MAKQHAWTQQSTLAKQVVQSHVYPSQITCLDLIKYFSSAIILVTHIFWPNNPFRHCKVLWMSNQFNHIYFGQTINLDIAKYFDQATSLVIYIMVKQLVWTQPSTLVEQLVRSYIFLQNNQFGAN